jgi:hypothetical protein
VDGRYPFDKAVAGINKVRTVTNDRTGTHMNGSDRATYVRQSDTSPALNGN